MRGLFKRGDVWYGRIADASGKIIKKRLSADKATAITLLGEMRKTVELQRAGILPEKIAEMIRRLDMLRDRYIEHLRATAAENSIKAFDIAFDQVFTKNQWKYISEITLEKVEAWARGRTQCGTRGQTINTYMTMILGAFRWAKNNDFIQSNPLINWRPVRKNEPRKRRDLQPDEVKLILATEWNEGWRLRWCVYFFTGLRLEAGSALRWEWIDWEKRILTIPVENNKSQRTHPIPIHPVLFDALKKQRRELPLDTTGEIFRYVTARSITRRFKEVCKKAGLALDGVTLHSVRHTVATMIYHGTGKDIKAVQEILGHAHAATTLRYLHLTDVEKAQAVRTLDYGFAIQGE